LIATSALADSPAPILSLSDKIARWWLRALEMSDSARAMRVMRRLVGYLRRTAISARGQIAEPNNTHDAILVIDYRQPTDLLAIFWARAPISSLSKQYLTSVLIRLRGFGSFGSLHDCDRDQQTDDLS
jgi:hypothetical protein